MIKLIMILIMLTMPSCGYLTTRAVKQSAYIVDLPCTTIDAQVVGDLFSAIEADPALSQKERITVKASLLKKIKGCQ